MKFNEEYTVEKHIIKFIQEKIGYEFAKPEEFSKLRSFENEYLITSLLIDAVKRINHLTDDLEAQTVVREIKKIDTNEGFLRLMRYGVNIKDPTTGKMRDYKVIDFENVDNNQFIVTRQFYFEGQLENIRPDILIFLNGLPIVDIEAKSPSAQSADYTTAVGQIKRYENVAPKLSWPNCFNIATDGLHTVYETTYTPAEYFHEWKDEDLLKEYGEQLEMTLVALLEKERLLDIIKNFIVFEDSKDGKIKKMARYQQLRAANKIVERVKNGEKKKGLIWHTQGSGKSLTMFFTAWKLRFAQELKNPKVFVLVDRIDLDDQIYDTFINCGGENIIRVTSTKDLANKITNNDRGIFISTIEKFDELPIDLDNPNENIIVLSDEAHRTNEGVAGIKLRSSMNDAFFFGFTGTPIDKRTLNTHRNFGEEGERYLDYYSIQQAIEDGATLPVTYEARLSKFFIDEQELDRQFDELTAELTQEQKTLLIKRFGKKEALIKLDKRMTTVIQDIVEHYKLYVMPDGFKAQIVCYDRSQTARYKELLDELVPKEWSEVIYSSGDPNIKEHEELKKYNTTKEQREMIIENFKNSEHPLKFLLVCDMLLTGFDAPIEQVMYLDKPLRDHNLLQAIARTNRVYKNKGCGKIIDYYGITRNLEEALNFDESIIDSAMIDITSLKEEFKERLEELKELFNGVIMNDASMDNLRKCFKIFVDNEEKQNYFKEKYARLHLLFEILSPDPFLTVYLKDFEWLTSFYIAFTNEFSPEVYAMKAFQSGEIPTFGQYGEKMKKLIQEKIDYEGITKNFRQLNINDIYILERLKNMSEEEKAANLERVIRQEVSLNVDVDPSFLKFSDKLNAIKKEFEQHQIDLAERIKRYYELLEDIKDKKSEAEKLGLDLKEYGLFVMSQEFIHDLSQEELLQLSRILTKRVSDILDKGWQTSSKREEFLKNIKQTIQEIVLKEYKDKITVEDFSKYLNRLVDVILKRF